MNKGTLVVISGFSGAGKGTVLSQVLARRPDLYFSVSFTTRPPREGEKDGVNYHFVTRQAFQERIERGEFLEYAEYVGNFYGTSMAVIREKLDQGIDVILEIEIQGALKVKKAFPDTLLLFITPPTAQELRSRLVGRGTETLDVIESRMDRACEEAEGMDQYDYLIVNDDLDTCVEEVHQIIRGEHHRSTRNTGFMEKIKEDLNSLKGEK